MTKGYGFSVEDIDWSCPADLQPYDDAHQLELQEKDILAWETCGTYVISALTVAIEHIISGNKAKSEYLKEPNYFESNNKDKNSKKIDFSKATEGDAQMAVFQMKQIMMFERKEGSLPMPPD